MIEPTFDRDGYPTDETLRTVREWQGNHADLMAYVQKAWSYPDRFVVVTEPEWVVGWPGKTPTQWWYLSTGGWSGNEDLIDAMQDNRVFWMMAWSQSRRGGHYWFEIRVGSDDDPNDDGSPDERTPSIDAQRRDALRR